MRYVRAALAVVTAMILLAASSAVQPAKASDKDILEAIQKLSSQLQRTEKAIREDIGGLKSDVGRVVEAVKDVDNDVIGIKRQVESIKDDTAVVRSDTTNIKGDVSAIRSDLAGVKTTAEGILNAINDPHSGLKKITAGVSVRRSVFIVGVELLSGGGAVPLTQCGSTDTATCGKNFCTNVLQFKDGVGVQQQTQTGFPQGLVAAVCFDKE